MSEGQIEEGFMKGDSLLEGLNRKAVFRGGLTSGQGVAAELPNEQQDELARACQHDKEAREAVLATQQKLNEKLAAMGVVSADARQIVGNSHLPSSRVTVDVDVLWWLVDLAVQCASECAWCGRSAAMLPYYGCGLAGVSLCAVCHPHVNDEE